MKRARINPTSTKQKAELQLRREVKHYLIEKFGDRCAS